MRFSFYLYQFIINLGGYIITIIISPSLYKTIKVYDREEYLERGNTSSLPYIKIITQFSEFVKTRFINFLDRTQSSEHGLRQYQAWAFLLCNSCGKR